MKAIEKLHAAVRATREGRHAEALEGFIWFHRNALAEDMALCGVRLSFALADWLDLGKMYPEALRELQQIRDDTATTLLQGQSGRDAFVDVAAIDECMESTAATYRLYLELRESQADLAKACARDALPAIIDARDYRLARQISPPPEPLIRSEAAWLNHYMRRIKVLPYSDAPRRWAEVRNFTAEVQRHLTVLAGNGEHIEAARLQALSVQLIQSPSLRKAVKAEFVRPSKPPIPREGRRMPRLRRR